MFTRLTLEEMERRRKASVEAMKLREKEEFEAWYQALCDRQYWTQGQCCAGCDHWQSSGGDSGRCDANGVMSGADVLKSMGVESSSYLPPPGFPFTEAGFHCGKFEDSFEWETLSPDYLDRIGACVKGRMKNKPNHKIER